jgi:hypothetical protein
MSDRGDRRRAGTSKRRLRGACVGFALFVLAAAAHAGSVSATLCHDTFVNSIHPDNNNGASTSFFTGESGDGGSMRALVKCDLPAGINERITVTQATFTVTTTGLGPTGTIAPAAATESLYAVTEAWGEGNKVGATLGTFTVGEPCTLGEASWNQRQCGIANWLVPGGTVAALSATASSPASIGAGVTFTGSGLTADIQNWATTPTSNYGWQMSSSTEGTSGQAQRFASRESGAGIPGLAITFTCKAGFMDTGANCSACTGTAQAACVSSQPGNLCVDLAPPSTYSCACNNAAYVGTGTSMCTDRNECIPNHCIDNGDIGAVCTDHPAPASGYDCSCDAGFVFNGVACSDVIFADGFE